MFSFPLYMTKGPEVINGRVGEQRSLEVRTGGKCPAHVSRASLLVPGNDDSSDDKGILHSG